MVAGHYFVISIGISILLPGLLRGNSLERRASWQKSDYAVAAGRQRDRGTVVMATELQPEGANSETRTSPVPGRDLPPTGGPPLVGQMIRPQPRQSAGAVSASAPPQIYTESRLDQISKRIRLRPVLSQREKKLVDQSVRRYVVSVLAGTNVRPNEVVPRALEGARNSRETADAAAAIPERFNPLKTEIAEAAAARSLGNVLRNVKDLKQRIDSKAGTYPTRFNTQNYWASETRYYGMPPPSTAGTYIWKDEVNLPFTWPTNEYSFKIRKPNGRLNQIRPNSS